MDSRCTAERATLASRCNFSRSMESGPNAVGLADEDGNYKIATGSQGGIRPGDYCCHLLREQLLKASGTGTSITDPKYANAKTSGLKIHRAARQE